MQDLLADMALNQESWQLLKQKLPQQLTVIKMSNTAVPVNLHALMCKSSAPQHNASGPQTATYPQLSH